LNRLLCHSLVRSILLSSLQATQIIFG